VEKVSTLTISPEYEALLRKVPPKVIRTEKENEAYTEILYEPGQAERKIDGSGRRRLAELLTLLVEDFEERHYKLPKGKPLDVVRFLMEQHDLRQKDLADVFGNAEHCFGSSEREAAAEQGTDCAIEREVSRVAGIVLLGMAIKMSRRRLMAPVHPVGVDAA